MLSFATGSEWKMLKTILTNTFSTGKIRQLQPSLNKIAEELVNHLRNQLIKGDEVEIVSISNKYLLEIIASSLFGLKDTGIFSSSNETPFEYYTKEIQKTMIRHRQARRIPGALKICNLFNLLNPSEKALNFFQSIITKSINEREENDENPKDLLQFLIEATSSEEKTKLSKAAIFSQALMFFFAGTEGPATLLIYGLYELALNEHIQETLYNELKDDGTFDFDSLGKLKYLDMFVCEVLRMYSSSVTTRYCSEKFQLPGTNIIVPSDTTVHTPIYGIHHDQQYYPNPFKFNPENFSDEAKLKRHPTAYIPFGIGPRSCIAQKFGLFQGKSAIAHLIYNFKVTICSKTEIFPKSSISSMYLPINGLWLKFQQRII